MYLSLSRSCDIPQRDDKKQSEFMTVEMIFVLLTLCERNPSVTGESPSALIFCWLLACTNCWTNKLMVIWDSIRPCDIIVMMFVCAEQKTCHMYPIFTRVAVTSHYDDVIMSTIASQITSLTIVYSTIYSGVDQSKYQSSASLAFVWGNHRGPVNSPHKGPVTRKMFPFDDVIMTWVAVAGAICSIHPPWRFWSEKG